MTHMYLGKEIKLSLKMYQQHREHRFHSDAKSELDEIPSIWHKTKNLSLVKGFLLINSRRGVQQLDVKLGK